MSDDELLVKYKTLKSGVQKALESIAAIIADEEFPENFRESGQVSYIRTQALLLKARSAMPGKPEWIDDPDEGSR